MHNLPNLLSASRMATTILVFLLILVNQPWAFLLSTVLFILASVTDYLDGYLARRLRVVSSLGIFLDLTADKVFVSAILIALVQLALVPAWAVIIIVAREFIVTGLRSMAAAKGKIIPAGVWGKQKTFITLVALGLLLLAKGLGAHRLSLFPYSLTFNSESLQVNEFLLLTGDVLLIVAVLWTIFSGIEYVIGALPLFQNERTSNNEQVKLQ
jgi:CDP-diacylglycerol--glycerol-3-phosphate 3-phosphatidyltransferase